MTNGGAVKGSSMSNVPDKPDFVLLICLLVLHLTVLWLSLHFLTNKGHLY